MDIRKTIEDIQISKDKTTKERLQDARRAFNSFKSRLADEHGAEKMKGLIESVSNKNGGRTEDEKPVADLLELGQLVRELEKMDSQEEKFRELQERRKQKKQ